MVLPSFFRNSLQELCNMNKRYCGFVVAEITEIFRQNMLFGTSLCRLHAFVCDFYTSSYVVVQLLYRVLAFSTNYLHFPLSWATVFQFGTFNFCITFLTSSTQRVFGLPIGLLEMGFQEYILYSV